MTDSKPPKPLGVRLREAREAKGWTQGRLDREAKLTGGSVCFYEDKGREPSIKTLRLLAAALDVQMMDLLSDPPATS